MIGQKKVEDELAVLQDEYGELDIATTEKTVPSSAVEIGRSDVRAGNIADVRVWVTRDEEVLLATRLVRRPSDSRFRVVSWVYLLCGVTP